MKGPRPRHRRCAPGSGTTRHPPAVPASDQTDFPPEPLFRVNCCRRARIFWTCRGSALQFMCHGLNAWRCRALAVWSGCRVSQIVLGAAAAGTYCPSRWPLADPGRLLETGVAAQVDGEFRPLSRSRAHADAAPVALNDGVGDGEAEPGATTLLGGEEGVED